MQKRDSDVLGGDFELPGEDAHDMRHETEHERLRYQLERGRCITLPNLSNNVIKYVGLIGQMVPNKRANFCRKSLRVGDKMLSRGGRSRAQPEREPIRTDSRGSITTRP